MYDIIYLSLGILLCFWLCIVKNYFYKIFQGFTVSGGFIKNSQLRLITIKNLSFST